MAVIRFVELLFAAVVVVVDGFPVASTSRKLSSDPNNTASAASKNSPLSSPISSNDSNPSSAGEKPVKEDVLPKDMEKTNNSSDVKSKNTENKDGTVSASSSTDKQIDTGNNHEVKEIAENNTTCKGSKSCWDQNKVMFACIQDPENGSKELTLLVQNKGEAPLKVNLNVPIVDNVLPSFGILSHQTKKINISQAAGMNTKIVLNAGNGNCEIPMGAPETEMGASKTEKDFLKQLSLYSKQVPPIYGAYVAFLVALVFGGTWAICNFRRRRRRAENGVAYQELEMALPESSTAVSAEDWDQDWDEEWDDDKVVMTPGGHPGGSISANGLTSRPKRDGWDD